jgi:hypothetical protein
MVPRSGEGPFASVSIGKVFKNLLLKKPLSQKSSLKNFLS